MLVLVCGLPGACHARCTAIVSALLCKEDHFPDQVPVDTEAQFLALAKASLTSHALGVVHRPDAGVATLLRSSGAIALFVPLSPEIHAGERITAFGVDRGSAIRQTTALCASLIALREVVEGTDIPTSIAHGKSEELVEFLAGVLDKDATPVTSRMIAERIGGGEGALDPPGTSPQGDAVVITHLRGYSQPGASLITLLPEMLFTFTDASRDACGVVDITGAARCLVFGPYFHLPPGTWTACYTITLSPDAVGRRFLMDVTAFQGGQGSVLARTTFRPLYEGCFTIALTARVDAPTAAIEVRLHSGETFSGGHLRVHHVNFIRIDRAALPRDDAAPIFQQDALDCFTTDIELWDKAAPVLAAMAETGQRQPVFQTIDQFEDQNFIAYRIVLGIRDGIELRLPPIDMAPGTVLVESPASIARRGHSTKDAARSELQRASALYVKVHHYLKNSATDVVPVSNQREFAEQLMSRIVDQTLPPPPPRKCLPSSRDSLMQAVEQIFEIVLGGESQDILWPGNIFRLGDRPEEALPEVIELVGPARVLFTGPYLNLPAGNWTVTVQIFFESHAVRRDFVIEIVTDKVLTRSRGHPLASGCFRWSTAFTHDQPEVPVAILMVMERGAIEGQIRLHGAALRQQVEMVSQQPADC